MRRILAATLIGTFAMVTIGTADEARKRELAENLFEAMGTEKIFEESFNLMMHDMPAQMKHVVDALMKDMGSDKLINEYVSAYVETYTEEELKGALEFYKSPIGQKFVEKQPELMSKIMNINQSLIRDQPIDLQQILKEIMKQESTQPQESSDNNDSLQAPISHTEAGYLRGRTRLNDSTRILIESLVVGSWYPELDRGGSSAGECQNYYRFHKDHRFEELNDCHDVVPRPISGDSDWLVLFDSDRDDVILALCYRPRNETSKSGTEPMGAENQNIRATRPDSTKIFARLVIHAVSSTSMSVSTKGANMKPGVYRRIE